MHAHNASGSVYICVNQSCCCSHHWNDDVLHCTPMHKVAGRKAGGQHQEIRPCMHPHSVCEFGMGYASVFVCSHQSCCCSHHWNEDVLHCMPLNKATGLKPTWYRQEVRPCMDPHNVCEFVGVCLSRSTSLLNRASGLEAGGTIKKSILHASLQCLQLCIHAMPAHLLYSII